MGAVGKCRGSGYFAHAAQGQPQTKAFSAIARYYRDVAALKKGDPKGFAQQVADGHPARERFEKTGGVGMVRAIALYEDAAVIIQSTGDY